jgi:hypothetical protein
MRLFRGCAVLAILLIGPSLWAAEIARWEAGKPAKSKGIVLITGADSKWTVSARGGIYVGTLAPNHDYYRRAQFVGHVTEQVNSPFWLVVEYLDEGYGMISAIPGGGMDWRFIDALARPIPWSHQWGVARLNTGRLRRAVFRLDAPASPAPGGPDSKAGFDLHIYGLEYLHALSLQDAEPAIEAVPEVKPAIQFARPFQRDINIATDTPLGQEAEGVAAVRNLGPLVRALGFNCIESYVQWNYVERQPGVYDWSHYDPIVNEAQKYGLKWFPLLIVGSDYALPDWFRHSPEDVPFECLEHHLAYHVQSIFCHYQDAHVQQFLNEFGKHYAGGKALLGLRLGPSGNYGEAQYPAAGEFEYHKGADHTHTGYWAADPYASPAFQQWLEAKYQTIDALNQAWDEHFTSFRQIQTFLPGTALMPRKQLDFANWYMGSMSDWCGKWAEWARASMPNASIYQSSGGWGPLQIGTDFTAQAKSMAQVHGGIRLTNESDNFALNIAQTRMASSAARFYGAQLGYEPGGYNSSRGVVARIYNLITNGGDHLFYYFGNLFFNDQAADAWRRYAPLIDQRAKPAIDVAAFYPDTSIYLGEEVLRYLYASSYFGRVQPLRSAVDFDFASEQMIRDGALDRYKVLVFLWGSVTEKAVLDRIDAWVKAGGTVILAPHKRGLPHTVEGNSSVAEGWQRGNTGKGRAIFFLGEVEPPNDYIDFIREQLRGLPQLRPEVHRALQIDKPQEVYWSVLEGGKLAILNFTDHEAQVRLPGGNTLQVEPYGILMTTAGR